jgi:hypothetical protein
LAESLADRTHDFLLRAVDGSVEGDQLFDLAVALRDAIAEEIAASPRPTEVAQALAKTSMDAFSKTPETIGQVVQSAAQYLSVGLTKNRHAGSDGSTITTGGKTGYPLDTGIPEALAAALLPIQGQYRKQFLAGVDDWPLLHVIMKVLPNQELQADEMIAFCSRVSAMVANDMMAQPVYEGFREWAQRNQATARYIVEQAVSRKPNEWLIPSLFIQILLDGVLANPPTDWRIWRDQIVQSLEDSPDEERWQLAVSMTASSWPAPPPPVAERIQAILQRVRRLPARLARAGMVGVRALGFDHPNEALTAMHELYAMVRPISTVEPAPLEAYLIEASFIAVSNAERKGITLLNPGVVLEDLLTIPPRFINYKFDSILETLYKINGPMTKRFLERWLATYASEIVHSEFSIAEALRQTCTAVGSIRRQWLVDWLIRDDALSRASSACIGREHLRFDTGAWTHLGAVELRSFAHRIVGEFAMDAKPWVPVLFDIAAERPDALAEVTTILCTDAVLDFPGICRAEVETRKNVSPKTEGFHELLDSINKRLKELQAAHERKINIPEVLAIQGASKQWGRQFGRMLRVASERAQSRSPLFSMVPKVPIARGESSSSSPGGPQTRFASFSSSFESPARSEFDPVGWEVARQMHLAVASKIMSELEPGPSNA